MSTVKCVICGSDVNPEEGRLHVIDSTGSFWRWDWFCRDCEDGVDADGVDFEDVYKMAQAAGKEPKC